MLGQKIRETASDLCDLAILEHATLSNCKWMSKIGITPQNYLLTERKRAMKTDALVKMSDS